MTISFPKEAGIVFILVINVIGLVTTTITMIKAIITIIIPHFVDIMKLTGGLMPQDIQILQAHNNVQVSSMEILAVIRTTSGIQAGIMLIRDKQVVSGSLCHLVDLQGCSSLWQY